MGTAGIKYKNKMPDIICASIRVRYVIKHVFPSHPRMKPPAEGRGERIGGLGGEIRIDKNNIDG